MTTSEERQMIKTAREVLRQGIHLRNMREDLMTEPDRARLVDGIDRVRKGLAERDAAGLAASSDSLLETMNKLMPARRHSGFVENFEVLVVAVAVAMAFRTYFIQPFKIPTGSMEPTLNGIHAVYEAKPGFTDYLPIKLVKWIVLGEWYMTVKAGNDGVLSTRSDPKPETPWVYYFVGNKAYKVPRGASHMNFGPGDMIRKGDVLWAGRTITGDHVFVDKIRWNFVKPQRGQVVVFSTKDIPTLPPGTHYIKRLIALPDEIISIVPPNILINGTRITTPAEIERIQRQEPGYSAGYIPAGFSGEDAFLARAGDTKRIPTGRYFALGDNTTNSRDSRYWGTIPAENMVGPAVCVYWPFRSHWGRIR